MGVGINYKGVGGNRYFDLNGVPTGEADALFKTPRRHKQLLPENFKKALHPQPTDPVTKENEGKVKLNAFDMRPDTLDKKTMPGSAVITSMSGLCLEGEQENPSIVGTKLYGSHGGKKGYHAFDDFDPHVEGGRVGVLGAGDEGADDSVAKAGVPFAYQISSRVVMEIDDLGRQILVEYDRDVQNTALGRTHTVTGERRRVIGIIDPNGDGNEFIHPYEVRWADSLEGEEDGGWIIWLPSKYLLFVEDMFIDIAVSNKLEAAGGAYANGWYRLGDLLPKDTSGELWLNINSGSAILASTKGEAVDDSSVSVMICKSTVDSDKGVHAVENYVISALILRKGGGGDKPSPIPDERSISRQHSADGVITPTYYWQIFGFGKFTAPDNSIQGAYLPPTILDLGEETDNEDISFLVRVGNKGEPDANSLGYKKVKISDRKSPFYYSVTPKEGSLTGELERKISNNIFYFDGVERKHDDYSDIPLTGFVYLSAIRPKKDEESDTEPEWTFQMGNEPAESSDEKEVINVKLYEFDSGKMVCDYRTTFLTLGGMKGEAVSIEAGKKNVHLQIEKTKKGYELSVPDIKISISGDKGIKAHGDNPTVLTNTGVVSVKGQMTDSPALNGDISFRGAEGSGLKFSSKKSSEIDEEQKAYHTNGEVVVDLDGREGNEGWGIRTLTVKGETIKFFGTESVSIEQSEPSGGLSAEIPFSSIEITSEGEIKIIHKKFVVTNGLITSVADVSSETLNGSEVGVVTGVDFTDNALIANMAKVFVLKSGNSSSQTIFSMSDVDVVNDVEYKSPTFSKKTTKVKAIVEGEKGVPATVFTTTPLSEE